MLRRWFLRVRADYTAEELLKIYPHTLENSSTSRHASLCFLISRNSRRTEDLYFTLSANVSGNTKGRKINKSRFPDLSDELMEKINFG